MNKPNTDRPEVSSYAGKRPEYFEGARADFVDDLPGHAKVLEIGCGAGGTGALALATGRAVRYHGVEIEPSAAKAAAERLTEVLVGDVEQIDLPWKPGYFDALFMSEVLEHLRDPWTVLRRLRPLVRRGGLVCASSPNVAHYRIIQMMLAGRWTLESEGAMDATHLRWFTPESYAEMFTTCGFVVDTVAPLVPLTVKQRVAAAATRHPHLFWVQVNLRGHVPA
ncbi:MAG: class I SAM-dependent methyltransferase [Candidatus Nanopelagicales bacterium]